LARTGGNGIIEDSTKMGDIDAALEAQLAVAWAGETGEDRRLGWWRTDLVSEFGGEDLFRRLMPSTWKWALFQAVREAARRKDRELRSQAHDPDRIVSLFRLGFELDEQIDERLRDLKSQDTAPSDALPGLASLIDQPWSPERFLEWVRSHGGAETSSAPLGRQLKGEPPSDLDVLVRRLVAGLAPLAPSYPLPHFRRAK
jgi:AcrR family transcriptional regulator